MFDVSGRFRQAKSSIMFTGHGMRCARRSVGAQRPASSTHSPVPAGSSRPDPLPRRSRTRLSRLLPALALLLCAFSLFGAAPAAAAVLVSNIVQTDDTNFQNRGTPSFGVLAQGFTTGSNTGGYTLTSIEAFLSSTGNATQTSTEYGTMKAELWSDSSGDAGTKITDLTKPASYSAGQVTFTAPAGTRLSASTAYHVVIYNPTRGSGWIKVHTTNSDAEDSGAATGWSIANAARTISNANSVSVTWSNINRRNSLRIRVNGSAATSTPTTGTVWSATLTVGDVTSSRDGSVLGCDSSLAGIRDSVLCKPSAALTDNDFTVGGTNYEIGVIYSSNSGATLRFDFDESANATLKSMNLCVGSRTFAFSSASYSSNSTSAIWSSISPVISMTIGGTVSLKIGYGSSCTDQQTQSSDATLSGLTASSATSATGTYSTLGIGSFSATTTNYSASVQNATTHVKLTPTATHSAATVAVRKGTTGNFATVTSGSPSAAIALGVGANEITVRVTAQDGTVKNYTVTITRHGTAQAVTVTLSASPNPVTEGGTVTVTATLSAPLTSTVNIPITLVDTSAEPNDHGPLTSITIPAGATKSSQGITTNHDPDDENEAFIVALGSTLPSGVVAGHPPTVTVTISDDEGIPTVNLSASPNPAVEGTSVAVEACLRKGSVSAKPDGTVIIPVRLSHGTSEPGDWGNSLSGHRDGRRPIRTLEHITINSQSSCGLVNIPIHRDSDTDNVTFTAAMVTDSLPASVVADATTSVEVTITDSANVVERPRPTGTWSPTSCSQAGVQSGVVGRTTMTVGSYSPRGSDSVQAGYRDNAAGALTSKGFSYNGTSFRIPGVYFNTNENVPAINNILVLLVDRFLTADDKAALALHAGGKVFHFADATRPPSGNGGIWSNAGLSWSEGQEVELCVTVARVSLSVSPAPVPEGGTVTVTATLSRAVRSAVTIQVTMHEMGGNSTPDWAKSLVDNGIPIAAGQKSGSVALDIPVDDDGSDATYRVILDYDKLPDTVQSSGSTSAVSINVRDSANADRPQGQDPCPNCARTVLGIAVDPALVAQIYEWRNDPQWVSYKSHTDRWDRVLLAFGETVADTSLTAMTAAEAQAFADQPWGTRWVEVAKTLKALEAALAVQTQPLGQPQTNPHAALIAQMIEWRNDPQWVSYKSHTDRWDRALLAFGETVADTSLTAMTAAEAQAFADRGWTRWVEVAKALKQIEGGTQPTAVQTPVVTIAAGDGVTEGAPAGFTLTAQPAPAQDIAVTVAIAQSGDVAQSSALGGRTVTISAGSTSALFSVATVNDTTDEPDGSVTATLGTGSGYTPGVAASATVAVADDDVPVPEISISAGVGVTEGAPAGFTLTAAPAPATDLAVTVTVSQSGAFAQSSVLGGRTVTIPASSTLAAFSVATVNDPTDEPDGSVTATLGTGSGYTLADATSATVAVADNDVSVPGILTKRSIAREGKDDAVVFTVRLDRASAETVFVDYETVDGVRAWARTSPATADVDYTTVAGTLLFAPGQTTHTVSVPIIDDVIDEGTEYFLLRFSNPDGATLAAGERETQGLIRNSDPLQKMWLSRFGRTVGSQVTDAVSERLEGGLAPGAHATVAGQSVDLSRIEDGTALSDLLAGLAQTFGAPNAPVANDDDLLDMRHGLGDGWNAPATASAPARSVTVRELLLGSSFHMAGQNGGSGTGLAVWGRVAHGDFDGEETSDDGKVRVDGEVLTGTLGADIDYGQWLVGVSVSLSDGDGTFDNPGVDTGSLESKMTTVSPYLQYRLTERVSAWGLAGWGTGDMTIVQDARVATATRAARDRQVTKTDIDLRMGVLGVRGALLEQDGANGMDLALKAEAMYVRTEWDRVSGERNTTGDASRVRLVLEGARAFALQDGATFRPSMELGVRHDGGDAETGAGVELGAGMTYTDPASGLSIEAQARMLVSHADSDYEEWGASASVSLDPGEHGRGLSFSLSPTLGAISSSTERLWGAHDARGLAPGGEFEAARGLTVEAGYGMALFGDRFTGTPNSGFGMSDGGAQDWRIGWRLTPAVQGDLGFEVNLDATRSEPENADVEHGVMLRSTLRW